MVYGRSSPETFVTTQIDPIAASPEAVRVDILYTSFIYLKGGDAESVSPGAEKSFRAEQRGRDYLTTCTRLAIDPTTARKSRKRLGEN